MDNQNTSAEDLWGDILEALFALDYSQVNEINEIEQQIYQNLQQNPQSVEGLITLMFAELMLGNHTRAVDIGNKIWGIGGSISSFFELVYLENLMNCGLLDMASILLKPRFERLADNVEYFYPAMIKFALMTGSIGIIDKLSHATLEAEEDEILFDLAEVYNKGKFSEQFKNMHKIIIENISQELCAYEYVLGDDNGFPELEIMLYVNGQDSTLRTLENNIENKITAYWNSCGLERLNNIGVSVHNIKEHTSWNEDGELYGDEEENES